MQQGSDSRGDLTTSRSTTWPPVCFVFAPLLSRAVFAQETQENRASRPQLMDNTEHAARSPPAAAQNRKRPLDGARIPSISIPSAIVPRIKEEAGQPGPAAGAEPHRGGKDHEPVTATVAVKHKRSSKPTDTREGARESTVPSAVTGIGLDSSTARARCSSELKARQSAQASLVASQARLTDSSRTLVSRIQTATQTLMTALEAAANTAIAHVQAAYEAEMAACARDFDTIGAPLSGLSSAIAAFDSGDARHAYSLADAALAACKPFPSTVNGHEAFNINSAITMQEEHALAGVQQLFARHSASSQPADAANSSDSASSTTTSGSAGHSSSDSSTDSSSFSGSTSSSSSSSSSSTSSPSDLDSELRSKARVGARASLPAVEPPPYAEAASAAPAKQPLFEAVPCMLTRVIRGQTAFAVSDCGRYCAVGTRTIALDHARKKMGLVHVYNLPSVEFRTSLFPYQGPNNPVRSICFVPRTTNLLISYTGSKLAEYSLEGLQLRSISTLELRYTRTVVCDGAIIAVSSFDNQTDLFSKLAVQVQSYATGDVVSSFTVKSASRFTSMALTKPGTHLLLMDDDISRLQMFSVQGVFVRDMLLRPSPNPALRPRSFAKMKRHLNRSGSVHVIDADHVVVGFPDGPVCVHDLHSGEFIQGIPLVLEGQDKDAEALPYVNVATVSTGTGRSLFILTLSSEHPSRCGTSLFSVFPPTVSP